MANNFTAVPVGNVVTITAAAFGNQTNTTIDYNEDGTGQTATDPTVGITDGSVLSTTQDSLVLNFKGATAPASQTIEFDSGSSQAQIVTQILAGSFAGITLVQDDTFDTSNNSLTAGSSRIKFTYDDAGLDTETASGDISRTEGNTNGTLATTGATTVTDGANETTSGTLTGFTVVVNGTSYSGTFGAALDAGAQAMFIASFLNGQT